MKLYDHLIFLAVSFAASVAGAICGIGGGVVIKPVLDSLKILSVPVISFLSGCTVLSMSCYSIIKAWTDGDSLVDVKTGTPLALGAVLGGTLGKGGFSYLSGLFASADGIGTIQSALLLLITLATMIYTLNSSKITTHHVTNPVICILTGTMLGLISSFLGIGGGPVNLVVLYYFFSMETKTAAQNSLYIVMFSQISSLLSTVISGRVPAFPVDVLVLMVLGGIGGGICGRAVNKKISAAAVDRLFIVLMMVIILICLYNISNYI